MDAPIADGEMSANALDKSAGEDALLREEEAGLLQSVLTPSTAPPLRSDRQTDTHTHRETHTDGVGVPQMIHCTIYAIALCSQRQRDRVVKVMD